MCKKIIFSILIVGLCVSVFTQSSDSTTFTTIEFTGTGGGLIITGYTGTQRDIVIPDSIDGKQVTIIGQAAFKGKNLTGVVIPDGVRIIRDEAFAGNALKNVSLGQKVVFIRKGAFAGNQLAGLTIPDSVITIEDRAFANNQLTELSLGKGLYNVGFIGNSAFRDNLLREISIGDGVLVGPGAFAENPLERVGLGDRVRIVDDDSLGPEVRDMYTGQRVVYVFEGWRAEGELVTDFTTPEEPEMEQYDDFVVQDGVLVGYTGESRDVVIPGSLGIIEIKDDAFAHSTVVSVVIPEGVETIGFGAFNNCRQLESVTIPEGVTGIGARSFEWNGLTSVTIPGSVTGIATSAFSSCTGLTSVTISGGVTGIENLAFLGCTNLTSLTIPDTLTNIGNTAFSGCNNLKQITVVKTDPDSDTSYLSERLKDYELIFQ